jgi:hypothetical protein
MRNRFIVSLLVLEPQGAIIQREAMRRQIPSAAGSVKLFV